MNHSSCDDSYSSEDIQSYPRKPTTSQETPEISDKCFTSADISRVEICLICNEPVKHSSIMCNMSEDHPALHYLCVYDECFKYCLSFVRCSIGNCGGVYPLEEFAIGIIESRWKCEIERYVKNEQKVINPNKIESSSDIIGDSDLFLKSEKQIHPEISRQKFISPNNISTNSESTGEIQEINVETPKITAKVEVTDCFICEKPTDLSLHSLNTCTKNEQHLVHDSCVSEICQQLGVDYIGCFIAKCRGGYWLDKERINAPGSSKEAKVSLNQEENKIDFKDEDHLPMESVEKPECIDTDRPNPIMDYNFTTDPDRIPIIDINEEYMDYVNQKSDPSNLMEDSSEESINDDMNGDLILISDFEDSNVMGKSIPIPAYFDKNILSPVRTIGNRKPISISSPESILPEEPPIDHVLTSIQVSEEIFIRYWIKSKPFAEQILKCSVQPRFGPISNN